VEELLFNIKTVVDVIQLIRQAALRQPKKDYTEF